MRIVDAIEDRKTKEEIKNRRSQTNMKAIGVFVIIYAILFLLLGSWKSILLGILMCAIGAYLLYLSLSRTSKWNRYDSLINRSGNTSLEFLAAKMSKSVDEVCEDLQDMITKEFLKVVR